MTSIMMRCAIALLLFGSLVVRQATGAATSHSDAERQFVGGLERLLRAQAVQFLPNPVAPPKMASRIIHFQRSGCAAPSMVLPFIFNENPLPVLQPHLPAGHRLRYVYLGGQWSERSSAGMLAEWLRHALPSWEASPYAPIKLALAIAEAEACAGDAAIDWRGAWRHATEPVRTSQAAAATG